MKHYKTNKYHIDVYADQSFSDGSGDNVVRYDFVYLDKSEYRFSSVLGIRVFQENMLVKSAVIGAEGGGTGIHDTSVIIESDRFLICCSDTVFCLSIPDLILLWRTRADQTACFEIYKYQESYIVHGECEISRLDKDGEILWQNSGADIFTTLDGRDCFSINDNFISATDWGNKKYKFDFNGRSII